MNNSRKCFLKCKEDSHEPISLIDNVEVIVGRSALTKIKNTRCSRRQISLTASTNRRVVQVKHLGENASSAQGQLLRKGETLQLRHGDTIELVHGLFQHEVVFEPPPSPVRPESPAVEEQPSEPQTKRQKLASPDLSSSDPLVNQDNKWEHLENGKVLVFTPKGMRHSSKIASYDFDWTIVATSSGRVYPKDKDDWCILLPEIPGHLKKLKSEGYKIVVFSNQSGISTGKVKISEFQSKVENVVARLGVPMQFFVATGTSLFRKPATGMWEFLEQNFNGGLSIDLSSSLYCGDAAGRPVNWAPKKKKDFSCSDRLFAMNIGVRFFTPEEHFLKARPAPFALPEFQPMRLDANVPDCHPPTAKLVADSQELVLMVGSPGSGKSFVARKRLGAAGYRCVNLDELKSASRCLTAVREALQAQASVVVDNTNPDKQSRARFVQLARSLGVACRCFLMATSAEHARHNNRFRQLTDPSHSTIPEMIIRSYEKKFEEPTVEEGFSDIIKVNFKPEFSDPKLKSLYEKFLL